MLRRDGRNFDEKRPVLIKRGVNCYAEGSVMITEGNTTVYCTASVSPKMPRFLRGTGEGWVTAEYSLLPRSTKERNSRESVRGKLTGRTMEIQRLIGRSLRAVVDLKALGEHSIVVDCDVLQADGGTRTASVTGAFIALVDAVDHIWNGRGKFPVRDYCAAISAGLMNEEPLLDLCFGEDSRADVDMNFVMTGAGQFIEIQGTGEHKTFSREQLGRLIGLGEKGICELIEIQKTALGDTAAKIGADHGTGENCTGNAQ